MKKNLNYDWIANKKFDKDILIYFPANSCNTCIEKLLIEFKELNVNPERIQVISGNELKHNFIEKFNDAFVSSFESEIASSDYFSIDVYEVVVLKFVEDRIESLLIFKPEEKYLFDKYFYPL